MALYELRRSARYEVVALLTTVAGEFDRVSHHGVRVELLEQQAAAVGVALHKLYLPSGRCTNEEYAALMEGTMREYCEAGVRAVAFGDIFLEDLRAYRERNLARVGMHGVFPIWHRDTTELVRTFIGLGFKAYLTCVDGTKLGQGFAGRAIDAALGRDLPAEVDRGDRALRRRPVRQQAGSPRGAAAGDVPERPPPRLWRPPSDAVRLRQLCPHRGPRPADRGSSLDARRGRRRFDRVGAVLRHHEPRRVALE